MLKLLRRGAAACEPHATGADWRPPPDTVWIDLCRPTREEELAVEKALGVDLPTLDEMRALEPSSRLYQEAGATFMTATLLAKSAEPTPVSTPVTFVLGKGVLVTIRYHQLRAFEVFGDRAPESAASAVSTFLGLLDAIDERLGEVLSEAGADVEDRSRAIFERPQSGNFRPLMTGLAHAQSVTSLARTSAVSVGRLLSFAMLAPEIAGDAECRTHLESLQRDVQSLTEQASYQSSHISFLLDAALGLINIEQNGIIKFFSVVAVVFLPPTLVASIYGMNFDHMPELHWLFGYPFAVGLMILSAVLPILWFKQRGWL